MKDPRSTSHRFAVLRIVAIYALFAALWIYFSDTILGLLVRDSTVIVRISVLKGFLFIVVTGALLYQLIARYVGKSSRMEEELRASQNLMAALLAGTTDAIYVKDRQGRYLLFNAAATHFTGKTAEEAMGHDDTMLFPVDEAQVIMAGERDVMEAGRVVTYEEHVTVADGTLRTFLTTKGPIFNAAGAVDGLFGIARDITEREKAERELRESEARFESLFENMLEGLASCRMLYENGQPRDFVYLSVNAAFERLLGLENVVGKRVTEVIPGIQESNPELFEIYGRVASTGKPERFETYVEPLDDWFSVSVYSLEKECFVAVFDVVTQRKAVEQDLRESEARFRSYVEHAPLAVFVADAEGRYVDCNPAAVDLLGYDAATLTRMRITDIVSVDDRAAVLRDFAALLDAGRVEGEYQLLKRNGEPVWVWLRAVRLNDGHSIAFCQDVTERRMAVQAMRERLDLQEQLARIAATVPGMVASLRLRPDGSTCMPYASRALDDLYGLQPAEVLEDATPALSKIHPDDMGHVSEAMAKSARDLSPFRDEWRVRHPRKGEIWIEARTMPEREADGSTIWHGFVHDVTARKQAEQVREATVDLLDICNKAAGTRELIRDLTQYFQTLTGCDAVGVRLRQGDDFPYYETRGFPMEFVLAENSLCEIDPQGWLVRDVTGHPALDCMCGNIIRGRFDPTKPFFTANGSFWSSCTTELLASTTEADRQAKTRNRCNGEGYESVALIPMRTQGETFGLFQFNDKSKGRFTPEKIAMLETLVNYVAIALAKQEADEALREASQFNQQVIASAGEGLIVYGPDLRYQVWNAFMERLTGLAADEVLGKHPLEVFPFLRDSGVFERIELALAGHMPGGIDFEYHLPRDDRTGWVTDTNAPLRNTKGEIIGVIGTVRDITERKQAELEKEKAQAQFLQAQKMETVGRLAGGVAHDFNNLLTAISGYAGFVKNSLPPGGREHADIDQVIRAAERAAQLTRQLLAFSRRQIIEQRVIDPNQLILEMDKMLRRLIGEQIELVTLPEQGVGLISADPSQIEQVLVNLAVNARDAMPEGGRLTVETARVTLCDDYIRRHDGVTAGEYVMLAVSDTGTGMTEEVKAHIFEPYFTTKGQGKGTGLGLATVFGIVKQHRGHIWVYSEPGRGTAFKIYLPRLEEAQAEPLGNEEVAWLPRGSESVLVVEDEPMVRRFAVGSLTELGYSVFEASNGDEALQVFQSHAGIDLLLTDVVLPGLNGKQLADRLQHICSGLRVLFTSGYTDNAIVHQGVLEEGVAFLQKPFTTVALARKVYNVLHARTSS
jgi:two-component system, cell cycle sensor histidine kinase and response regulator CckA